MALVTRPPTELSDAVLQRIYDLRLAGYSYEAVLIHEKLPIGRATLVKLLHVYTVRQGLSRTFPKPSVTGRPCFDCTRTMPYRDSEEWTQDYHPRMKALGYWLCHFCERQLRPGLLFCERDGQPGHCREAVTRGFYAGYMDDGLCGCPEVAAFLKGLRDGL